MTEFWLISAPGDRSPQQTWEKCKVVTRDLSMNYRFLLPELKVFICIYLLPYDFKSYEHVKITTIKQLLRQGDLGHSLTFFMKQAESQ